VLKLADSKFKNHTGGVIQVTHTARWGSVPEALLEDKRLDLDSRAVAAWLAIKPAGWQINVDVLRRRLASDNKKILGKDRWQRIAAQLEACRYLVRKKINGAGGKWIWDISFNAIPAPNDVLTVGGFSGSGVTSDGSAGRGVTVAGQDGYIDIPIPLLPISKTTTTTSIPPLVDLSLSQLIREPVVVEFSNEIVEILKKQDISDLPTAQQLIDELAGRMEAGKKDLQLKIEHPLRWFRKLVGNFKNGEFDGFYWKAIQKRRERKLSLSLLQEKPEVRPNPQAGKEEIKKILNLLKSAPEKNSMQ